jgi:4-amino-4-deoxy-L-arabinose transferase-like glycosyltransferase
MHWLRWIPVAAVVVWAAWALLNNLGQGPLQQYDEGTYAQVVQESFDRGDFLTFNLGGKVWFEKPPLYFWLAGAATAATGDPILGIRLPAAVAGILLVMAVMLLVYQVSRNPLVAAGAGALLLATQPFIQGAREARFDLLLALFIVLALYCAYRALFDLHSRTWWWAGWGIAVGLAVLSKSVLAVFAVIAGALLVLYLRDHAWLHDKKFWWGVILGAVIVLPWHVYETALYGMQFWESYLGVHVLERYDTNLFGDPALQTNYTVHLFVFAPLITGLTLTAAMLIPLWWRSAPKEYQALVLSLAGTIVFMLLVFYTAQTRAFSYLLPVYPLAAALVALSFPRVANK